MKNKNAAEHDLYYKDLYRFTALNTGGSQEKKKARCAYHCGEPAKKYIFKCFVAFIRFVQLD